MISAQEENKFIELNLIFVSQIQKTVKTKLLFETILSDGFEYIKSYF
jgi:hypothetical protein